MEWMNPSEQSVRELQIKFSRREIISMDVWIETLQNVKPDIWSTRVRKADCICLNNRT
jgi:hypothetical protein